MRYDNTHTRFVTRFLLQYLPSVCERVADSHGLTFGHDRLRAVLVPDRASMKDSSGIGVDSDTYKIIPSSLNDGLCTFMTDVENGDDGWTFNHYKKTPKEFKLYPVEVIRWFEQM